MKPKKLDGEQNSVTVIALTTATEGLRQNTVAVRLKLVLLAMTPERGRFPSLEQKTGIPTATWRTWWTRGGTPSGLLLEAVGKLWPEYAYWLLTGHTDVRCGHDMPELDAGAKGYISNWPEETTLREKKIKTGYSREYFKVMQEIDAIEDTTEVSYQVKIASLRMISNRRKDELTANFSVKMAFETDL